MLGPPESVEQQRATTEMDSYGGPVSEVSGPPEATASLARGGLPLQARHQRRLQPPSGTLSPPTAVISDSAFEKWFQSDEMEMSMFSLSEGQRKQPPKHMAISAAEGPQQSAPTAVALAAAAPAAAAVTGTRVFLAVSSKGVAEAPASSAGAASAAVSAVAPATGGTVFPTASVGGVTRAPASADGTTALTASPATGGIVPSAASVGGAPTATSEEISAAEPATSGTVPSAAPIRWVVGARESSAGALSSDAAAEAAPSTGGTASPVASAARAARALAPAAGSAGDSWLGNICGERGAYTHPFDPGTVFPLEVRYYNGSWLQHGSSSSSNSSSSGSSSSSNDNTSDHDSWWDATCVGALLRPFDSGKRCRRSTRKGRAVLGVDPFDRGREWGRMQHGE